MSGAAEERRVIEKAREWIRDARTIEKDKRASSPYLAAMMGDFADLADSLLQRLEEAEREVNGP